MNPMRLLSGSTTTAAISGAWRVSSRSTASRSFHGSTSVSATRCFGTPALDAVEVGDATAAPGGDVERVRLHVEVRLRGAAGDQALCLGEEPRGRGRWIEEAVRAHVRCGAEGMPRAAAVSTAPRPARL